jgi:uncharacterized protein YyaL (SSP411 family)
MLGYLRKTYRPRTVVSAAADPVGSGPGLLRDRPLLHGLPTAYVCEGFVCNLPVNDLEGLKQQLG